AHPVGDCEAVDGGQHHVEDHEVEGRDRVGDGQPPEGPPAVGLDLHLVALRLQVEPDAGGEMVLVLHDEDARAQPATSSGAPASDAGSMTPGSVTVNVEPRSGPALSASAPTSTSTSTFSFEYFTALSSSFSTAVSSAWASPRRRRLSGPA